jgi:hypothetical protein
LAVIPIDFDKIVKNFEAIIVSTQAGAPPIGVEKANEGVNPERYLKHRWFQRFERFTRELAILSLEQNRIVLLLLGEIDSY